MGDLILLLFLADLGVMVAALYDCITTDPALVRNLPKLGWVVVILVLSGLGGVLWFFAGRPAPSARDDASAGRGSFGWPDSPSRPDPSARPATHPEHPAGRALRGAHEATRPVAPDDDPDFLRSLTDQTRRADEDRLRRWEADLRLREERLRQRENPPDEQV